MAPKNLTERFEALDENLKLDPAERKLAEEEHNALGDLLVKAGVAKRTRLQGSFARKTMLPPLHDIDKIIEMVDELWDVLAGPGGPEKAMHMIGDALTPHLPGARFEVKKHALGITPAGRGFAFDGVPAFNPGNGSGWIVIADTEDRDWEPSNTYILIETIAGRNQACDGHFVHQVRMVKQAVRVAGLEGTIPGLHSETYAFDAIKTNLDHPEAVARTFASAARMLAGSYTDPTGADLISDRLAPQEVQRARQGMERLRERAAEAQRLAAAGNEDGAARIWGDIFGEPFPSPDASERGFLTRLYSGAGVDASGHTSIARPTPRTRPWRPD